MLEFTYPPGSAFIPIANWETRATLNLKNLPSHLSICSSVFLKGWAADAGTALAFFQLIDHDRLEGTVWNVDDSWAALCLGVGQLKRETKITAFMGLKDEKVEITAKEKLPLYFAQSWIRACMSLDTTTGMVRIVVDGKVLEDALHPKIKFFVDKMPTNFTIRVGNAAAINAIFANVDMFLEPPSLDKMVAMTTSGSEECGARGDLLNWDEAEWTLSDKWANGNWADWVLVINASKVDEIEWMNGPCWRESKIKVYQLDGIHDQTYCMMHCKKISNGRSPSVTTLEDWKWLIKEVASISTRNQDHCHLWLAATEGDTGKAQTLGCHKLK